jgi:hypothetical protein
MTDIFDRDMVNCRVGGHRNRILSIDPEII